MSLTIEQLENELTLLKNQLQENKNASEDDDLSHDEMAAFDYIIENLEQQIDLLADLIILRTRRARTRDETEYYSAEEDTSGGYTGGDSNFNDGDY
jgi:hypothetical protein